MSGRVVPCEILRGKSFVIDGKAKKERWRVSMHVQRERNRVTWEEI